MSKKALLALAILSIIALGGSIYVCVIEQTVSNFMMSVVLLVSAIYFVYQYRKK